MDAAARAELDRLRRRVYGPDAGATSAEIARLTELEAVAHAAARPTTGADADTSAARITPPRGVATAPARSRTSAAPLSQTPPATGRSAAAPSERGGRTARAVAVGIVVIAAAAVVGPYLVRLLEQRAPERTVVIEAAEAYTLVRDPDAIVLERIPLETDYDQHLVPQSERPHFPSSGEVNWAFSAGTLYGWEVWLGGVDGVAQPVDCIALRRDDTTRARCVNAVLRGQSALAATLPYDLIPAGDRPAQMTPRQRIGLWWTGGDTGVMVLLADARE
ncbi:hypothetical protein [Microbacterium fluvii]|nr:hypothetical protein [Microbacterium fluvii]MCU4672942.1 hypothetical protein [Microbacterium fluvii]